ncbi:hypothetical protein BJV82DRAFT_141994 [Fennellomyces sp. T-0311]|nr:hypothetical protein BJV82DRAFT_141994 [Fennellomyces sp. T-0311]
MLNFSQLFPSPKERRRRSKIYMQHERQFTNLPIEVLLLILDFLPITDLLTISAASQRCYQLINEHHILANKLKTSTLRLYFDQESRWRCSLDMKLVRHDGHRFTFKPVDLDTGFRMFSSKVLRDPSLYKVTLDGQNMMMDKKPTSLKIKAPIAYWKPLDAKAVYVYSVHNTPTHWVKARPGERWMLPLLFQCSPRWFMHDHHGYTKQHHRVMEVFS